MIDISETDENGVIEVPIDGILDLHNFSPKDLKYLIPDYLEECRRKSILQVRIIHGKGIGNLRRTVHSILQKIPSVVSFRLAGEGGGSWGATLVILRKLQK
jgi:DNA-nicking Smr family endonuclease